MIDTIPIDATSEGHPGPLVILPPPPEPPAPPTGLTVRSIDGLTVTLQWQPPASGTPPASYQLEGGINPGQTLAIMPTGSKAPVVHVHGATRILLCTHALGSGLDGRVDGEVSPPTRCGA